MGISGKAKLASGLAAVAVATGAGAVASAAGVHTSTGRGVTAGTGLTPVFIAGNYHGRRPAYIGISGDAGDIVTKLHWSNWGHLSAFGVGTSNIQGCVPNCAAGSETPVVTKILFEDAKNGYWTKMIESRDGTREVFHYTPNHTPDLWPGDAS